MRHRRQELHIEKSDEGLAQNPQHKKAQEGPEKSAMNDSFYFFSYIRS